MVTDKRKLKRKTYANNFKKKLKEMTTNDPEKYEKRITKMKNSSNRSSRVYQRRMRVGKDPKKSLQELEGFSKLYMSMNHGQLLQKMLLRNIKILMKHAKIFVEQ